MRFEITCCLCLVAGLHAHHLDNVAVCYAVAEPMLVMLFQEVARVQSVQELYHTDTQLHIQAVVS